jgi:hypothetical protein
MTFGVPESGTQHVMDRSKMGGNVDSVKRALMGQQALANPEPAGPPVCTRVANLSASSDQAPYGKPLPE